MQKLKLQSTSQFIRHYWRPFSRNSLVFINACGSASPAAADFKQAIKDKEAAVYAGWTENVHTGVSIPAARFVFDRMLGANRVEPEADGYKQRAFDHDLTRGDLDRHGLLRDTVTGAELTFERFTNDYVILAPSIANMTVDENRQELTINGIFGTYPGPEGRVTINCPPGSESSCPSLTGCNWTPGTPGVSQDRIVCQLPSTGPQSSGDVVVTVRGHKSNVAQLTEWGASKNGECHWHGGCYGCHNASGKFEVLFCIV